LKLALLLLGLAGTALAGPIEEGYAARLADAIWHAEGGKQARVSHGVLSVPTRNAAHARAVCLNTIRKNWDRWEAAGSPGDFVEFLGAKYAPLGAKNDPKGLNKNWVRNVKSRLLSEKRSRFSPN
jgi:hypothetical protein